MQYTRQRKEGNKSLEYVFLFSRYQSDDEANLFCILAGFAVYDVQTIFTNHLGTICQEQQRPFYATRKIALVIYSYKEYGSLLVKWDTTYTDCFVIEFDTCPGPHRKDFSGGFFRQRKKVIHYWFRDYNSRTGIERHRDPKRFYSDSSPDLILHIIPSFGKKELINFYIKEEKCAILQIQFFIREILRRGQCEFLLAHTKRSTTTEVVQAQVSGHMRGMVRLNPPAPFYVVFL